MGVAQADARERGQMTVELAVVFPALLAVAVIAVNALLFFSECAAFDRVAREAVRLHAASPAYGQGLEQGCAQVAQTVEQAFDRPYLGTRVAVEGGVIVGFADLGPDGYLDRLYVHRDWQGRGVASALCDALPAARTTHASITARPFFEKRGYQVLRAQQVERRGILLTNYIMEKTR